MSKILYFLGGVAVGSAVTFFALRSYTERAIETETENVRQVYKDAKMQQKASESVSEGITNDDSGNTVENAKEIAARNAKRKADLITTSNIIESSGYSSHPVAYNLFSKPPKASDIHNGVDENEELDVTIIEDKEEVINTTPDPKGKIYTITPEAFINEQPFYDKITLEYYDDDILAEALSEEIITDINAAIGKDALTKFGEYEEDVVYVRNDKRGIDYEVILQHRPFAQIPGEYS